MATVQLIAYHCHPLLPPTNEVWSKVMFLHLSVILFRGGSLSRGRGLCPGGGVSVQGEGSLSGRHLPRTVRCGQYVSYWNAFLLNFNYGSKSNSSWEYDSQKTDTILMLSYFNYSLFVQLKTSFSSLVKVTV